MGSKWHKSKQVIKSKQFPGWAWMQQLLEQMLPFLKWRHSSTIRETTHIKMWMYLKGSVINTGIHLMDSTVVTCFLCWPWRWSLTWVFGQARKLNFLGILSSVYILRDIFLFWCFAYKSHQPHLPEPTRRDCESYSLKHLDYIPYIQGFLSSGRDVNNHKLLSIAIHLT